MNLLQARVRTCRAGPVKGSRPAACVSRRISVVARYGGEEDGGRRTSQARRSSKKFADEDDSEDDDDGSTGTMPRYRRPASGEEAPSVPAASAASGRSSLTDSAAGGTTGAGGRSDSSWYSRGGGASAGGGTSRESNYRYGSQQQRSSGGGEASSSGASYSSPDRRGQYSMAGLEDGGSGGGGGAAGGGYAPRGGGYGQRRPVDSAEASAQRYLTKAISQAAGWEDLAKLLNEKGHQMNSDHISSIMEMASFAVKPEDDAGRAEFEKMVSCMYGWAAQLLPTFKARNAAAGLLAVATLEYFNSELVTSLCATCLTQMGNLSVERGEYGNEYYNVIWALAQMSFSPGPEWLAQFEFRTERKLTLFTSAHLCDTFLSLSKLGHLPSAAWMAAFCSVTATKARLLDRQQLIQVLTGAANIRAAGGPSVEASWVDAMLSGSGDLRSIFSRPLQELLGCLTQLDYQPQPQVLTALCEAFALQMRVMTPGEVASVAYSLAYLKAPAFPPMLAKLLDLMGRSPGVAAMTGDEQAYMAAALAAWKVRPNDRWMDDFVLSANDKLSTCSPAGLAMLSDALPALSTGHRLTLCVNRARELLQYMQDQAAFSSQDGQEATVVEGQEQQYADSQQVAEAVQL